MSEVHRFSRDSFIYILGETVSKSLGFILLPIYARYLSVEDFGILFMVAALWPVITVFLGQSFSTYILRGYFDFDDKKAFCGTVLVFSTVSGLVLALIIHSTGPVVFGYIFKHIDYRPYLQYSVFFALFRLYFTHVVSIYRAKRQAMTSVLLSFIMLFVNLLFVLTAIFYFHTDLQGILNAQLFAYVAVALIYTFRVRNDISLRLEWHFLLPATLFVLPLVPHALAGWVANYVSRIFVERNMSLTDLSVFTAGMQLALILGIINNGLNQAWGPYVYSNYERKDFSALFTAGARKVLLLVLLIASGLIIFSKELLLVLGKTDYLNAVTLMPILVIAYVPQIVYFIYVAIIIHNKKTKLMPLISVTSGLFAILANILLVPTFGMTGAAICTGLAFSLMAVQAYWHASRCLQTSLMEKRIVVFIAALIIIVFSVFVLAPSLQVIPRITVKLSAMAVLVFLLIQLKLLNPGNIKQLFLPA